MNEARYPLPPDTDNSLIADWADGFKRCDSFLKQLDDLDLAIDARAEGTIVNSQNTRIPWTVDFGFVITEYRSYRHRRGEQQVSTMIRFGLAIDSAYARGFIRAGDGLPRKLREAETERDKLKGDNTFLANKVDELTAKLKKLRKEDNEYRRANR
jgi:hypothetical protein